MSIIVVIARKNDEAICVFLGDHHLLETFLYIKCREIVLDRCQRKLKVNPVHKPFKCFLVRN